jgi:hypothetical protein
MDLTFPAFSLKFRISFRAKVVDDGARKDASDITEEKLQIRQALCPLQEALSLAEI